MTIPRADETSEASLTPVEFDPFADASPSNTFPLSEAQREIWSVVQMGPEASCAYNLCFSLRLAGALSIDALRDAVNQLFARHDALRSAFEPSGEWQAACPPRPVEMPVLDLAGHSPADQEARLQAVFAEEVETPFDLVSGPPTRVRLVVEAPDRYVLVFTVHHIVCDGGSTWVVFQDLAALYEAARRGQPANLPPAQPFIDLVQRQAAPEGREEAAAALVYWETQFEHVPAPLDLPLDEPRPAIKTYRAAQETLRLDEGLTASIKRCAAQQDATIVGFLLAAFQVLLHRLTGQADLVVGLTASVRDLSDLPDVVGHATNLLPLRISVDPDSSFATHLRAARSALLEGQDHRALTFGTLVRRLSLPRDPSRTPLVAVTFNFARGGVPWRFADVQATLHAPARRHMNFELELNVLDTGRGFALECAYNPDLFAAPTVKRWLDHYRALLASIVADSGTPLDRLPLLTDGARAELRAWNATAVEVTDACVHELISREAERRPHRAAVEFGGATLSYGELERRSAALAGRLRSLGVKPGIRVGVFMERSPEMIVGLLGILKAGGAYVPLDPAFPKERLAYMVEDSGAAAILTDGMAAEVPSRSVPTVRVDEEAPPPEAGGPLVGPYARPDDLAYVIYTSGSTGRPKGVAITHRSLVNLLESMGREPGLTADDVLLSVTTLSFDIAALELYLPLLKGARIALASRQEALDGRRLIERLASSGATAMQATPATWRLLLESGWEGTAGLRVLCGGEGLPRDLAEELLARAREVWNVYGPTETTVWSSALRVEHGRGAVSIGRPIANTQMWILDRHLEPMPPGVPGELYIGGAGLARGYWHRPELTAERFVADPFSAKPGSRLYRTGDLARWRPDGTLECLGRIDHQVKVRGFRIELGEIEARLREAPGVEDVAVVAQEATGGDRRLVAYVAGRRTTGPERPDLRSHLKPRLPAYMIPSSFVLLDALPLTPNGKVDRKALMSMRTDVESRWTDQMAPRTATEEILAGIYAEVLQLDRVGVEGDFFELGGHSLLATQVISRVRNSLGVSLPIGELFNTPTVAGLASRVEALRGSGPEGSETPIRAEPASGWRKLSASQRRLWFFDRLEPGSSAYNIGFRLICEGTLDVAALERSLGLLVARHETLRSRFQEEDGESRAVVLPPFPVPLRVVDLSASPLADAEDEAVRLVEANAGASFDLEKGPLLRAHLVRISATRHVLGLTLHHIVSDGWSLGVLVAELLKAYEAFAQGREPDLPPLPFQYGDFAAWEERWLTSLAAKRQLDYWSERLAGPLPVVDLPTDSPRPKVQTFRGGEQVTRLSADLSRRVAGLSRKQGATPFMTYLAAFALVMNRQTGLDDLPIGVPVAGRNRDGTERLVGVFINTVVFRYDFREDSTFAELLVRTRTLALDAYRNAEVPFDRVVDAVNPRRDPGRTPLFQVLVNSLEFGRRNHFELPGLTVEVRGDAITASKFDLTLYLGADENGTALVLSYNADVFQASRMRELLSQIEHVLEQATAHPDRRLAEISLLTPSAQARIPDPLRPLGGVTEPRVMHGLAGHAARQPSKPAVADPRTSLDYAGLDRLSRGLARRIRAAGVSRGDIVALRVSRSADLVWGLCGVLRAGAGFVVLDAAYPSTRLAASIEAAAPRAFLESPGLPEAGAEVRALLGRPGWALQAVLEPSLAEGATGPDAGADEPDADDLAYVAFTSGTTGGVKGIVGTHGPLAHFLDWHTRTFLLTADDRFSMLSGLSHDPLLRDVFTPLRLGASLHIPDPDDILAPGRLRGWMAREGITVAHLTPALARVLAADSAGGELPHLRYVFLGGDVLTRDEVRELRHAAPGAAIVNFYGATETPQAMGFYVVPAESEGAPLPLQMPLGQGIDDVQLLVLDKSGRLAGIGEVGEIAVRTPHLARGYLGDEALTRERFVTSPFSGQPGDRLYRTGDLARYRPDGLVEFAGRADTQVKVRGFRVELGEVESALREHPLVSDAAAVLVEVAPGDQRLVAYVVAADPAGATERALGERLRSHLKAKLPAHMIPSSFVRLDALPLTQNGKVDRRALGKIEVRLEGAPGGEQTAPRTAAEEIMAGIWAEVLRVERVGVDVDFFEIGGHSLLATQVVSRVRKALGVELTLRDLFDAPTVAGLAARVEAQRSKAGSVLPTPTLRAEPWKGPAELSYAQQRLWFLEQLEPGGSANVIAGALRMDGALDTAALERALAAIVGRHESLRTTFVTVDGAPVQHVSPPGSLPLPLVDLSREADPQGRVDDLVQEEVQRGFDLARGPLFSPILYRLGPDKHVLLVCMHHIVSDGWSIGVLVRELSAFYEAGRRGETPRLPELPLQYRDFARWQRGWLQGDVLTTQIEFWRSRLSGAPQVLELPTDRPRPAIESHRGARFTATLPRPLLEGIRALSRREGVTLFSTLLAAFSLLLSRYTGQLDLLVGSPVANRNRAEIEGLIGFFVNTLILRTTLSGDPTVGELLARVREECLQAFSHQDLPFEKLVEELRPERDASRNPLFQVMLVLQNAPIQLLRLAGLDLRPLPVDRRAAQLDLTLYVHETPEGLLGTFEYATDLFEEQTIARMAAHWQRLLEGMVESPGARLSEMPLLTAAEESQLARWNATAKPYPRAAVHDLFVEQARRVPERIAVECGGAQLTYRELEQRSGTLAAHLRSLGVGPGVLVGIFMERSLDMLVGVLAVLRAGGAYVPLDPAYPKDRLAYMVEDSGTRVLLTQKALVASLPVAGRETVCVDGEWGPPGSLTGEPDEHPAPPESLAYVIYTSGSTGRPKGVAVTHRSLVNLLSSMAEEPGLREEDRLLSVTTLSFDIAGLELFLPLLTGAHLVLVEREEAGDGRALRDRIASSRATVMQATPATWRLLLEAGWEGQPGLKVLCGGEALPRDLANALVARAAEVWNVYGPTETTIWSSAWRVTGDQGPVPIGAPIANTGLYVLDRRLDPAPIGVPGELYIGGHGLARGYWKRPDLTAERFLPDPFSPEPGARMYRTGDLARRGPDGTIECLGRLDHQVKVRGFRIELDEIESALRQYPGVEMAVVLAQDVAGGDRRLVAYLSHGAEPQPNVTALRNHLKGQLPVYMVPSSFVFLDRLPLTPNGKLDRKALALLETGRVSSAKVVVPPRTPTEKLIAELWQSALGVADISVRDNFFDLGGHSLLAMRVLAGIEKQTGHHLHPRDIIFQTLEQLAAACEGTPGARPPEPPRPSSRGITRRLLGAVRDLVGGRRRSETDG